ncbi:MAG: FAD-dependent oxidoreductase [Curvibacter sp.]|nr:MAG: FAD-dependent oxidoreductase [Curvibacter sp.]
MQLLDKDLSGLTPGQTFDVVVVGAGGAGLSAALFAAIEGARVLVVEKTEYVGGTTALSAATTWVPGTQHGAAVNPQDSLSEAARYLDNAIGDHAPRALREAFLAHGRAAVEQIEAHSEVRYRAYAKHPDYISDLDGSTLCGRALEPLPFDGRRLGPLLKLLRPPIPEFTVLGGMMVDRNDINHLLGMTRSWASLKHSIRILTRHGLDRLSHPRGTRLVMGNALIARLLYSLAQHERVSLALNTSVCAIGPDQQGLRELTVEQADQRLSVQVRGGVVLASGGFNRHPEWRQKLLPGADERWCPAAPGHTGQAQSLAQDLGARHGRNGLSPAFWAPVSLRRRPDGSQAVFPHFVMDRAKPGMVTVNQAGERFVNESTSYHLFGLAMQQAHTQGPAIPAYLVCDAKALRQYGLGMVRPGGAGLAPFLADGYLVRGQTLGELATQLKVPAEALQRTVEQINRYAETGVDPDFHRGETAYQQNIGDATAGHRNPNLGPLSESPYYAIRLYPGDIGASTGLVTDAQARLLDAQDQPLPGLYAVGNDMNSIMGGVYTAPGITIGPGLVFAYLAARHACARARSSA